MIASKNLIADCTISLPVPSHTSRPVLTELMDDNQNKSGWGFTAGGLCINLTEADREEIFSHMYTPTNFLEGIHGG